jgi:hypothetical protein
MTSMAHRVLVDWLKAVVSILSQIGQWTVENESTKSHARAARNGIDYQVPANDH